MKRPLTGDPALSLTSSLPEVLVKGPVKYHCEGLRVLVTIVHETMFSLTNLKLLSAPPPQTSTFLQGSKLRERGCKGVLGCFDSEEMPCLARLEQGKGAGRGTEILVITGTTSINPDVKTRALC